MEGSVFTLEIVTPQRVVFSGDVTSFIAPGVAGSFQVLHNHAPLMAALMVGEVRLWDAQGVERRYSTSGGFVEVKNNHVVMLGDSVEPVKEIDLARAEGALERAKKRLHEREAQTDLERARKALARAKNRIRVAGKA